MGANGDNSGSVPNDPDGPTSNGSGKPPSIHGNHQIDTEGDLILDPLLKYFNVSSHQPEHQRSNFDVDEAIEALKTQGYYHIPSVLTEDECKVSLNRLWDFVEDASGGCVRRRDPSSWYPAHEIYSRNGKKTPNDTFQKDVENTIISNNPENHDDLDPWPHTGYHSFPDMFQSLGAGYVLGNVREHLAERVFEPLFGTRELVCSKEGFTFSRPLSVDLKGDSDEMQQQGGGAEETNESISRDVLIWKPNHLNTCPIDFLASNKKTNGDENCTRTKQKQRALFRVCGQPQPLSEGQHYDQGVPVSALKYINNDRSENTANNDISKKQQNRNKKKNDKRQRFKDMAGLCHIQASVSFTDQTIDQHRGGGHFLCHPRSHSTVHWKLVGGTYRATSGANVEQKKQRVDPTWVALRDNEIQQLIDMGYPEKRIYAKRGDVILWRSDLVHAGVAPSLIVTKNSDNEEVVSYDGPKEFRAVGYCSMLPVQAAKDYTLYSLPKQKLMKGQGKKSQSPEIMTNGSQLLDTKRAHAMLQAKEDELMQQKLESFKTGRTGDHRPEVEEWHAHRRGTMWNTASNHNHQFGNKDKMKPLPPRMLQRPRFRLGAPALTIRQAELYGLLPYRHLGYEKEIRQKDIERAVIRGVRFVEGLYKGRHINGDGAGPWAIQNGKFFPDGDMVTIEREASNDIPICLATMEVSTPHSASGASVSLSGQDKYLGGMASPCGRYIYGVPGHAKRVIRVDVHSGDVNFIGPDYDGEFKWLRGVEIPGPVMGTKTDGSLAYPSGCCLALPCNSEDGCVLKIDPETSKVTTFVTGSVPNVEEGWLYHGGNLASDGYVYAIPASASRVMKIDPRLETTEFIGPVYEGKAKWYGGITGSDGCIYGIPHNSTGVMKIDPKTQEVTILAEGTLPEGLWKWHGGLASLDGTKIIGFPNNADSVLVIDVPKQQVYTVGDSSILRSGYHRVPQDGRYKYLGGACTGDGKLAYLFPCDAEYVLRFDMTTNEMRLVGPHLTEGENKFQNGFVGDDGCIYGIPQRSSGVLRIIPPKVRRYGKDGIALPEDEEHVDVIYCGDDMVSCKDKFEGGVLGFDGKIYCIPLRAKAFVNIITGPSISTM